MVVPFGRVACPGAVDIGHAPLHVARRRAHDLGYPRGDGGAAHRAGVRRGIAPHDGLGQGVAPGIAAAAAVVARQRLTHRLQAFVRFYGEQARRQTQQQPDRHADPACDCDGQPYPL